MVRTEEETRAPSVKEPASLLELCEEALRSRAATRSREVLDILELARFTHRTALEEACVRAIWRNFAMLRERHGPEELRAALGDVRYEKFEAELVDFLESKAEVARLRSGQVIELEPCADIEPDEQGNFPLEVLRTGAVWPSGVDPANREMRLHDETFQQLFKMDKAEFAKLPSFVRIREKRDHARHAMRVDQIPLCDLRDEQRFQIIEEQSIAGCNASIPAEQTPQMRLLVASENANRVRFEGAKKTQRSKSFLCTLYARGAARNRKSDAPLLQYIEHGHHPRIDDQLVLVAICVHALASPCASRNRREWRPLAHEQRRGPHGMIEVQDDHLGQHAVQRESCVWTQIRPDVVLLRGAADGCSSSLLASAPRELADYDDLVVPLARVFFARPEVPGSAIPCATISLSGGGARVAASRKRLGVPRSNGEHAVAGVDGSSSAHVRVDGSDEERDDCRAVDDNANVNVDVDVVDVDNERRDDASVSDAQAQAKLFAAKSLRALGVGLCGELLTSDAHGLPVVVFGFLTLFVAAIVVCMLQKPWQAARQIPHQEWARIVINGFLFGTSWVLWAKGLQACGLVRTLILEHSHVCVTGVLAVLAKRKQDGPAKTMLARLASGELLYVVAFFLLSYDGEQFFGGVVILLASSLMRAVWTRFSHKIARDIGGPKKLHALSLCAATALLMPLVILDVLGEALVGADYDYSVMSFRTLLFAAGAACLALVLNFYAEAVYAGAPLMGPISLAAGVAMSALLGHFPSMLEGVASICALVSLKEDSHRSISASSDSLLPTTAGDPHAWSGAGEGALEAAILDSRRIVLFLLLNLAFMFVEILVGLWSNSLGLISDAGHMLFDCMALFIGLFASFVSRWNPDHFYTYGYARFETLCAFVNGVFLVFIAIFIMTESLERISDPPELGTSGLLTTSILGFLVNLVGLVFFHGHSHLGDDSCGGHGHSHGGGHSHAHHGNENMHGVFLHILADALGSLGVIVSSILIEYRGWFVADPICSLLISLLILSSVYPLLKSTASTLLLSVPPRVAASFKKTLNEILLLDGVSSIREPKLWMQSASLVVVSLHVIIEDSWETQQVLRPVEDLLRARIPNLRHSTIQVYHKGTYYTLVESQRQRSIPRSAWVISITTIITISMAITTKMETMGMDMDMDTDMDMGMDIRSNENRNNTILPITGMHTTMGTLTRTTNIRYTHFTL
ncbi:Zinc transporter 5 [Hondaea fermentalgiana]|uniref:Zinc transporter 5 n=1 Tax=Hondaea fermentalgiana TaxID=2315210 RepID=A0A2R5GQK3_9STRA|nr:Zinc transporter 5 [Hondaea fermentalgiana]|eukprot:GBG30154.1 Zinc transporter 5 [Hondaea fermentalgiana]